MSAGSVLANEGTGNATSRVKLRRARFEDCDQIAELESRFGLNARRREDWRHLWLKNPAYRDLKGEWDIGWVLEDADGRIVASVASIPLWYELDGQRILAWTGKGLVGEPAHRNGSLLLLDHLINRTKGDLFVNNTLGVSAASAFDLFECSRVPVGAWDKTALWIASHKGLAESMLAASGSKVGASLVYPLKAATRLWECLKSRSLPTSGVDVQPLTAFDERFDDFWDGLRKHQRDVLLAVRTRESLTWHYKRVAGENRLWISAVGNKSLAAYAIFERKDGGDAYSALKRVRLADFQSLDGSAELLPSFLHWAIQRCRREGIHFLEVTGRWLDKGDLIDTLAPYHRKLPVWTYFYSARKSELVERLKQQSAWAPSLYDGDATL